MERGWESVISNQYSVESGEWRVESGEWRGGREGKGVAISSLLWIECKGAG
jgi:hypothetical protein